MLQCGLGMVVQAQHAQEPIDAQGCLAKNFRQPAGADAAVHFHLPEPVLGVREAQGESGIGFAIGIDVGYAVTVPYDFDRGL